MAELGGGVGRAFLKEHVRTESTVEEQGINQQWKDTWKRKENEERPQEPPTVVLVTTQAMGCLRPFHPKELELGAS